MAYALRYYKEIAQADGGVVRLEIHKKDSTTAAVEIGAVVQGLSLEIQGQQDDIDSPIQKTSLHMTFVDASDIENGQKNGFWQEFYTPDALMWKVILKAKDATETSFRTIWGGYVTPDSFSEDLVYRGSVSITARDNIGHMQDFPFDSEGDADGMISLYNLVESGWEKIQSPMMLEWRGAAESTMWLMCDGVSAMFTLMNVSMFEGMDWYKAIETALASYGVVMRYVGNNIVKMSSLRSMPYQGEEFIEDLIHIEPTFVSGATRELIPAVKRIEESVDYDLGEEYQPRIETQDFSGNTFDVETSWGTVENIAWSLLQSVPMSAFGWYNETPFKTLAFNPNAYEVDDMLSDSDKEDLRKYTCVLTGSKDDNTHSLSYAMSVNAEDFAINVTFGKFLSRLTHGYGDYFLGYPANEPPADYSVRFAVSMQTNGITYYLTENGVWSTEFASQKVVVSGDKMSVNVPLSGKYTGRVNVSFTFLNIDTSEEAVRVKQILALSLSSTSNKPMLENNTINTNYQEGNNVILTRDPELAPALNTTALPAFIKNGIFYRSGNAILPAKKWSWGSGSEQQMAVWNHLQLLSYYAKPNNLISGTIVNADVTRAQAIYVWHGAEHILVSGRYNFLNGHIESAVLREFARYEDMWNEVAGADLPDTEQDSRSNVEGGSASGGSSSTYSNTTTVNIGSGGGGGTGASNLNDLLDVDTAGVVAQSVLYYNGTSWVDMSLNTLLNPYLKADVAAKTYASKSVYESFVASLGSLAYKNGLTWGEITNVLAGGDEFNIVPSGHNGVFSFNHRAKDGGSATITEYRMRNGGGSYAPVRASSFIAHGGTSSQFLKADGSLDSTSYLSTSGGTISGASGNYTPLIVKTTSLSEVWIAFEDTVGVTYIGSSKGVPSLNTGGANLEILHAGNYSDYVLPKTGGTIDSPASIPLIINSTSDYHTLMSFHWSSSEKARVGHTAGVGAHLTNMVSGGVLKITDAGALMFNDNTLIHSGNIGSYGVTYVHSGYEDLNTIVANAEVRTNDSNSLATPERNYPIKEAGSLLSMLAAYGSTNQIYGSYNTNRWFARGGGKGIDSRTTWREFAFTDSNVASAQALKHSNGTIGAVVNSSGNVTIGASDLAGTSAKLYVDGDIHLGIAKLCSIGAPYSAFDPTLYNRIAIDNAFDGIKYYSGSWTGGVDNISHEFIVGGENKSALAITNGGNVLIGTTTDNGSDAKLQVNGAAAATLLRFVNNDGTTGSYIGRPSTGNDDILLKIPTANDFYIATNGTERMRITRDGNVGIGTDNPSFKLHVNGTAKINDIVRLGANLYVSQDSTAYGLQLWGDADGGYLGVHANGSFKSTNMRFGYDGSATVYGNLVVQGDISA